MSSPSMRTAKLAALLAFLSAAGHPSIAPTWHAPIWIGRPRRRRPVKTTPLALTPRKPETRRSRRNVPRRFVWTVKTR